MQTYSETITSTSPQIGSFTAPQEDKSFLDSTVENIKDSASSVAQVASSTAESAFSGVKNVASTVGSSLGITEDDNKSALTTTETTITTQTPSLSQPDALSAKPFGQQE